VSKLWKQRSSDFTKEEDEFDLAFIHKQFMEPNSKKEWVKKNIPIRN
jgi:hypothetical protein